MTETLCKARYAYLGHLVSVIPPPSHVKLYSSTPSLHQSLFTKLIQNHLLAHRPIPKPPPPSLFHSTP